MCRTGRLQGLELDALLPPLCPQALPTSPPNPSWSPSPAACAMLLSSHIPAVADCILQEVLPPLLLDPQAPLHPAWEAISSLGQPLLVPSCTLNVGVRETLQLLGTEAGLVVPRAVGLLGVLELAVTRPRVGVVEVAVDGWEERWLSGSPEPAVEAPRQCRPGSLSAGM